jgi:hypothetical protein
MLTRVARSFYRAKHVFSSVLYVLDSVQMFGGKKINHCRGLPTVRWTFSALRWTFPAVAVDEIGGTVDVFGQLSTALSATSRTIQRAGRGKFAVDVFGGVLRVRVSFQKGGLVHVYSIA